MLRKGQKKRYRLESATRQHQVPVQILVDSRATETCLPEGYANHAGLEIRLKLEGLTMSDGSQTESKGTIVSPDV